MIKIKQLELPENYRMIVISDIHGNLEELKKLLKKVEYCPEDYLMIVGDICEKGSDSAGTVCYLRTLSEQNKHVYFIMGNCDDTYEMVRQNNKHAIPYLCWRNESVVNEWLHQLGYQVTEESTCQEIVELLENSIFRDDIQFLADLPHAIETKDYIFVHAGIENKDSWHDSTVEFVTSTPRFFEANHKSDKIVIVGHYPVSAYDIYQPMNFNPKIDLERKIIALDGANVIKPELGQLNALIIEYSDKGPSLEATYVKREKTVRAKIGHQQSQEVVENIVWPDFDIELVEKKRYFTKCKTVHGKTTFIKNECIDYENSKCLNDTTSFLFSYEEGDYFEVLNDQYEGYLLVKKEGTIGWVDKTHF